MVREFSKRNIKVVVFDLRPPAVPFPPNVHYYTVNVTDSKTIEDVSNTVKKDIGDPTILINNAGIVTGKTILGGTEQSVRRTFEVNTISHFALIKAFLPAMIRNNHGHIVTLASMASFATVASNVDYSCSKAAALVFHEGLAQELRLRYNATRIRTTYVHCPFPRSFLLILMSNTVSSNPSGLAHL